MKYCSKINSQKGYVKQTASFKALRRWVLALRLRSRNPRRELVHLPHVIQTYYVFWTTILHYTVGNPCLASLRRSRRGLSVASSAWSELLRLQMRIGLRGESSSSAHWNDRLSIYRCQAFGSRPLPLNEVITVRDPSALEPFRAFRDHCVGEITAEANQQGDLREANENAYIAQCAVCVMTDKHWTDLPLILDFHAGVPQFVYTLFDGCPGCGKTRSTIANLRLTNCTSRGRPRRRLGQINNFAERFAAIEQISPSKVYANSN